MILSIDPGMNSPGVALFVPNTPGLMLRHAARIAVPASFATMPDGARWMHVALEIVSWAHARTSFIDQVVFEKPQWYPKPRSKGDPNKLVGIAGVAANVTGMLSIGNPIEVFSPTPAEWIGQLPKVCPTCGGKKTEPVSILQAMMTNRKKKPPKRVKKVCEDCRGSAWETPRGRRIRSRLSAEELALVPDQNDAIDAVGLGLWRLGRLAPVRPYSNGRDD